MKLLTNPDRCPICRLKWDFVIDLLGRLYPRHQQRPCVPVLWTLPQLPERPPKHCIECGGEFVSYSRNAGAQFVCGDACRKVRDKRKRIAANKLRREALKAKKLKLRARR